MRIAFACDHAGFSHKEPILEALQTEGHVLLDLGTFSEDPVDYPDFARVLANAVRNKFVDFGVLVCGSGVGASIAANKVRGIRAALVHEKFTARQSRADDDANIICLGARVTDAETAVQLVREFLDTPFSSEERDVRRVAKIMELETGMPPGAERVVRTRAERLAGGDAAAYSVPAPASARPVGEIAPATTPPPAIEPAQVASPPRRPVTTAPATPRENAAPQPLHTEPRRPAAPPPIAAHTAAETERAGAESDRDVLAYGDAPEAQAEPVPAARAGAKREKRHPVEAALTQLEEMDFADRLWIKDASLWSSQPEIQATIKNRLGWLTSPTLMREYATDLKAFATEIRRLGFTHVLLLGMGGSSLAPEVMNLAFGSKMGFPDFTVLDSTDPAAVKNTVGRLQLPRTLFMVSSKSGTTPEVDALYRFFRGQTEAWKPPKPGQNFVAITDPGSALEKLAKDAGFRRTFLNHPSIGGRFSALSFFGLVPAALIGVDLDKLLERAGEMVAACSDSVSVRDNPGLVLGAWLGGWASAGRDKVTLVLSEPIRSFGAWLEQLLAESTGKDGKGLVPVDREPLGPAAAYGNDRVFVSIILEGDSHDPALETLAAAGHPVYRLTLRDPYDLGGEFFRWELATATVGALLGVNPFDEPNVTQAKEATQAMLATFKKSKRLPDWSVDREEDGILLLANQGTRPATVTEGLGQFLGQVRAGDYVALLAYLTPEHETTEALQGLRTAVRDRLKVAATIGYGPRYLHSIGQLHKGGPPTVHAIQLTCDDKEEVPIPGEGYGFSALKAAQALGDLDALRNANRKVIRLHLGGRVPSAIEKLTAMVKRAIR
jgi:RpiB/LacA/LacB family sugar-phosphate isomerase